MLLRSLLVPVVAVLLCKSAHSQTFSSCNPLYTTGCPPNTALGKSINIDFTQGGVNSFTPAGNPTYDATGAHFTVGAPGDAPQLISVFYIMFGKVEISMKAAPGAGIVSSLVLQSDTLDEIDIEWLGADDSEMQTNYFGKGDVTTYNRGAFNSASNNQAEFKTYAIDWTEKQITWSVDGKIVRVLTPETADKNQYPQSPMQIKFGSWSGGDASNPPGTVEWARGPTDYSKGPFTMTVRSLAVTDYSTGTQYQYGDNSGNWPSIVAVGGGINGNSGDAGKPVATADVPAVTSVSPSIPAGIGSDHGITSTRTGWPWVAGATTLATATNAYTSAAGLPSGWVISSSGKIVPASSAATMPASTSTSSLALQPSPSLPPLPDGGEVITAWDDRGFPMTRTVPSGWQTMPKSFDDKGFLITGGPGAAQDITSRSVCLGVACGPAARVIGTSTSTAGVPRESLAWGNLAIIGLGVAFVERFLLQI